METVDDVACYFSSQQEAEAADLGSVWVRAREGTRARTAQKAKQAVEEVLAAKDERIRKQVKDGQVARVRQLRAGDTRAAKKPHIICQEVSSEADEAVRRNAAESVAGLAISWAPHAGPCKGEDTRTALFGSIAESAKERLVRRLLAKQLEAQTMTGAARVWRRFARFSRSHRFDEHRPKNSDVEDFCYDKGDAEKVAPTVPRTRWDALHWCARHLNSFGGLDPATRPPVKTGATAKDANPAVEAEPAMLIRLERAWQRLKDEGDWREGAILGAIAECLSGARYKHLRRSRFLWQSRHHYAV